MNWITPNWNAPKQVKALASTRIGGCSKSPYEGLNLGMHVGDDPILVQRNRELLQQQTQMPTAPVWLNQTHSTVVLEVAQPTNDVLDADGVITSSPNVVCSAMTADCLPVLITNTQGTQVAAVHAGWRGLAGGIVENALTHFSNDVMLWLGPAIGPQAFEVGEDVLQAFLDYDSKAEEAFVPGKQNGKWWANMATLTRLRMAKLGIDQVFDSGLCTYQDPQRFYSYRRDGVTGRQATFIWINEN
ncbi:peptidoglycan editing factor PgeF [Vibrio plantisponsor]|uniref:Purine nucleoside phosphorylase n=1 Tax=Vibrio plantisponsor TaxID=664643 RepID=A0ABU4ICE2_9VIBR|nr:peptidoglycan editing factor PgeF [Vibrio plantisponsor]MDW6016227.1 peptidoglycan editing factor PgeF [Vibrio plantisponsor]NNM41141.1 peptidoglycan editing factor PgeF [Vibrio plantisponsor]